MIKKIILIASFLMSVASFGGEVIGARFIDEDAENVKINNFEIHEDWKAPVVEVRYEIDNVKMGDKNSSNKRRKSVYFLIDEELLTDAQLDLISEERGFFSSSKKQRNLAKSLFTIKRTRGLSGTVLLLELK